MVVDVVAEHLDLGDGGGCDLGHRVPREQDWWRRRERVSSDNRLRNTPRARTKGDVAGALGRVEVGEVAQFEGRFADRV